MVAGCGDCSEVLGREWGLVLWRTVHVLGGSSVEGEQDNSTGAPMSPSTPLDHINALVLPALAACGFTCDSSWKKLPPRVSFIHSSLNRSEHSTKLSTRKRAKGVLGTWSTFTAVGLLIEIFARMIACLEKCRRLLQQCSRPQTPLSLSLLNKPQTGDRSLSSWPSHRHSKVAEFSEDAGLIGHERLLWVVERSS